MGVMDKIVGDFTNRKFLQHFIYLTFDLLSKREASSAGEQLVRDKLWWPTKMSKQRDSFQYPFLFFFMMNLKCFQLL